MNGILRRALALAHAVIECVRIDDGRVVIGVRPWKARGPRCPVCGRRRECYDRSPRARSWRAPDLARSMRFLEYRTRRALPRPRRAGRVGAVGPARVLGLFLDELARERGRAAEVVTADGAKWIEALVRRRCPSARWVMDPFHVAQWMNDALDDVRRGERRVAKRAARDAMPRRGGPGGPRRGEETPPEARALKEAADAIKGSRYALVKSPENLTDAQRAKLDPLKRGGGVAPARGAGAEGGPEGGLRGGDRGRSREAAGRMAARRRPLQDRPRRGRREEGARSQGGRHGGSRARYRQRPRRGGQQQDQGDGEGGVRIPQRGQPRGAADASMLRLQAPAPRKAGNADRKEGGLGGPLSTETTEGSITFDYGYTCYDLKCTSQAS